MERWEKINAVQKMQDYINNHINDSISLSDLAHAAGYSPFHSARIFKELMGKAPFEYIRTLRLSQAALRLRDTDDRVLDVALDFVFDSHEGFTRAFSKAFGITPYQYSKTPPPIGLFMPTPIKEHYLLYQKGEEEMAYESTVNTVFVQVIDRPKRKLILKRGRTAKDYFTYCEEVGCDVWGILCSIKEALYEPIGLWLPKKMIPDGTSEYAQGVEVPEAYDGIVPEGFDMIELPPCQMMIFQGQPFEAENYGNAVDELYQVIKTYQPELYGFRWDDVIAPRFQMEPQPYRGYIEGRPVVDVNK